MKIQKLKIIFFILQIGIIFFSVNILGSEIESLYNVEVEIPINHQIISPGTELIFTTKILDFNNQNRVDIQIEYLILNNRKEKVGEINSRTETVAIETQASFVGNIKIPEKIKSGKYLLQVKVTNAIGKIEIVEHEFEIISNKKLKDYFREYLKDIIFVLSGIILIILIFTFKQKFYGFLEKQKTKKRITEIINFKIKSNKITKKEIKESKLREKKVPEEEKIF